MKFYEHCVLGEQKRVGFSKDVHNRKKLWELSKVPFKGGAYYILTIIYDYSKEVWVFFLKLKNDVLTIFKQWKTMIKKQTRIQVKRLRTDNSLEFCSGEFNTIQFSRNFKTCYTFWYTAAERCGRVYE